jgi:hypothetical protein
MEHSTNHVSKIQREPQGGPVNGGFTLGKRQLNFSITGPPSKVLAHVQGFLGGPVNDGFTLGKRQLNFSITGPPR